MSTASMYLRASQQTKTTLLEKIIYGLGGVGANLCWTFMAMFVTMYYTNSVGLAAAAVGTFMLVSRILDGISDLIFAAVMRKAHMKLGYARPWFLICAPMLGVSMILSFNVPGDLSETGRLTYAFATYAFTAAVSYTIFNMAFASFLPLISQDDADRTKTASLGNVIIMIGVVIMSMVTPLILAAGGGESVQGAWTKVSTIYAILCTIFVGMLGLIKEKSVDTQNEQANTAQAMDKATDASSTQNAPERVGFAAAVKCAFSCKYTWILLGSFVLMFLGSGVTSGVSYYQTVYLFGGVPHIIETYGATVYTVMSLLGTAAMVLGISFSPLLFSKFGKRNTIVAGLLLAVTACVLIFLNPTNYLYVSILRSISSLGLAPMTIAQFVFVADLSTYILKKSGQHMEEIVAMTSSVSTKVGTGLGSAAVGWGLALFGFEGALMEQTAATLKGIAFMNSLLPAIFYLVMVVCLLFWNLEKKMAKMEESAVAASE